MTDLTAANIAGGEATGRIRSIVAGLGWAGEALRALKAVTRAGLLTDEAAVRGIALRADAVRLGSA